MTWYWIRYIKINVSNFSSSLWLDFSSSSCLPFISFDMALLIIYHIDLKIVSSFCVRRFFDLSNAGCEKVIIRLSFSSFWEKECANTHKKGGRTWLLRNWIDFPRKISLCKKISTKEVFRIIFHSHHVRWWKGKFRHISERGGKRAQEKITLEIDIETISDEKAFDVYWDQQDLACSGLLTIYEFLAMGW
jgi:hypothetical protein